MIILDTLRADKVLSNFNNRISTPFIKNILKNSIYFENCISHSPWTLPSHISIFTGLYLSQNGLISKDIFKISEKIPVLTEILKNLGYYTIGYTENAFIGKMSGLNRGFNTYSENWKEGILWNKNPTYNTLQKVTKKSENLIIKKKGKISLIQKLWNIIKIYFGKTLEYFIKKIFWKKILFGYINNTIEKINNLKTDFKENLNKEPYFFFLNIMATHYPYLPIIKALQYFKITLKDFKIIRSFFLKHQKYNKEILNIQTKSLSIKKLRVLQSLYYACVYYADSILKRIFQFLENLELLKNSYVIITSDHGEHLCTNDDHFLWEHQTCHSLYEPLIKVPLIIYNSNFKQKTIKDQVKLKDLYHTILHLTGIPAENNIYLKSKKSIISQIESGNTPKYIFGEYLKNNSRAEKMLKMARIRRKTVNKELIKKIFSDKYFLRTNTKKYIAYGRKIDEFYDLLGDPCELNNTFSQVSKEYLKMKEKIKEYLKKINNINNLRDLLTKREKEILSKSLSKVKLVDQRL